MKNTNTNKNTWTFAANSVTVNGRNFEAKYSVGKNEDVYVFATVNGMPIRVHVGKDMPEYTDCLAAAKSKPEQPKPAPVAEQPKLVDKPAPVAEQPKPEQPKPAPVAEQPKPKQPKPAPVAEQPKPKAAKKSQPKSEQPKPAPVAEQPKPVDKPAPVNKPAPVDKPWIGTTLVGKGFNIAFDEATQRTRVLFQGEPSEAQKAAINAAGFYWSAQLNSWNKKLTCKAYRAALALVETLNALAA